MNGFRFEHLVLAAIERQGSRYAGLLIGTQRWIVHFHIDIEALVLAEHAGDAGTSCWPSSTSGLASATLLFGSALPSAAFRG